MKIQRVRAMEILDSRGNPTVQQKSGLPMVRMRAPRFPRVRRPAGMKRWNFGTATLRDMPERAS